MAYSNFRIVEKTATTELWEAECPFDPTIKPRRLKEVKQNETVNHNVDIETDDSDSSDFAESEGFE